MLRDCFADEVAIDFPSVEPVVERMRDAFLGERADDDVVRTELLLSVREAEHGLVAAVEILVPGLCGCCGGRGETWTEPCVECCGTGDSRIPHRVRVSIPRGVSDGARLRFRLLPPDAPPIRVEVRVLIRSLKS
jgi:hypothetical protein